MWVELSHGLVVNGDRMEVKIAVKTEIRKETEGNRFDRDKQNTGRQKG